MSWVGANLLIATVAYTLAGIFAIGDLMRPRGNWQTWGRRAYTAALALHVVAAAHVLAADQESPGSSVGVLAASLAMSVFVYVAALRPKFAVLLAFAAPLTAVVLFSVWQGAQLSRPMSPEVHRLLTPLHIVASIFGVVAFAVAFVASALFVVADAELRKKTFSAPGFSVTRLDRIATASIGLGFPLYSVGIVLGGVWALRDGLQAVAPQYVFAVASWLVYGVLLHGRLRLGWRGRRAAVVTMLGFLAAISAVLMYAVRAAA